ncbi:hypothetical protein BDFB_008391 [Asbolus verrucosus]|uniref:Uncharacterized protein n=1 Tax=Asbolus verrucosus TaxID=1661398 RepID=A0A482VIW6_ASBVE|nr:hypothetical protein BDFB_008391 [Asbolus verrucosus]
MELGQSIRRKRSSGVCRPRRSYIKL